MFKLKINMKESKLNNQESSKMIMILGVLIHRTGFMRVGYLISKLRAAIEYKRVKARTKRVLKSQIIKKLVPVVFLKLIRSKEIDQKIK